MLAKTRECPALFAFVAVIAIGAEKARAGQKMTLRGVQISWDGQGEMELARDGDGEFSLSLRLNGNVVVEGERFDAKADRLMYDAAKKLVSLESSPGGAVHLSFQLPDDGPRLHLAARKIIVSLSDGRIKVDGGGILGMAPGEPPKPAPQGDVPCGD